MGSAARVTDDMRDVDRAVEHRLLELAYRRTAQSVLVSLTAPVIFVWLMRSVFGNTAVVWLAAVWVASLVRGGLWFLWRRNGGQAADRQRWASLFFAGSVLGAIVWSAGATALTLDAGPRETLMLAIMMLCVTALGSNAQAPHLPSSFAFILITLVPITVAMFAKSDPVVRIAGLAVVVGTAALVASVLRAHRELASLFRAELQLSAAVAEAVSARTAAEEASLAKSAFLANMSHELRTPLNAILGYSEMLLEDARASGAEATAADLEKVTTAGHHLLALISDVLDLSKIEAGRMDVRVDAFDPASVVQRVLDTSGTLASAGGNTLTVEGLDTLGPMQSDAVKLQQVLLNLVGNACKFTSHGRVHVACRRERVSETDWIVIEVRDTGIGMPAEHLARLFGQFMQADTSDTRRYGGTGLGLAISQRLCHLLGGAITVQSVPGKGSTFAVRLPAVAPGRDGREDRPVESDRPAA